MPVRGGFRSGGGSHTHSYGGSVHSRGGSSTDDFGIVGNVVSFAFGIPTAVVTGIFYGVGVAFNLASALVVNFLAAPLLASAISGIFIGVSIVWIKRGLRVRRETSDPIVSALFSTRIAAGEPLELILELILHAAAGYLVFFVLAHIGLAFGGNVPYAATLESAAIVVAGSANGGFGGGLGGGVLDFLFILVALIVAGALFTGPLAAALLSVASVVNWTFFLGHSLQAATASVTYKILTTNEARPGRPHFGQYVWESAVHGAREGALVGIVIGALVAVGHLFQLPEFASSPAAWLIPGVATFGVICVIASARARIIRQRAGAAAPTPTSRRRRWPAVVAALALLGLPLFLFVIGQNRIDTAASPPPTSQTPFSPRPPERLPDQSALVPPPPPSPPQPSDIEAALNLDSDDITNIKGNLRALGFDLEKIDGILDESTRAAIKEYQVAHDLALTGYLDEELIDAVNQAAVELSTFAFQLCNDSYRDVLFVAASKAAADPEWKIYGWYRINSHECYYSNQVPQGRFGYYAHSSPPGVEWSPGQADQSESICVAQSPFIKRTPTPSVCAPGESRKIFFVEEVTGPWFIQSLKD